MNSEGVRRNILGFMYAERLKSVLIIAGQMLDVLADLNEGERSGGLKMFGSFVRGVGNEMRLAANVMGVRTGMASVDSSTSWRVMLGWDNWRPPGKS